MAQSADDQKSGINDSKGTHLWPTSLIVNSGYAMALSCIKCNGIPKACLNNDEGEILCTECAKHFDNTSANKTVQKMISKLKTKCVSIIDGNEPAQTAVEGTKGSNVTDEMEGNSLVVTHVEDNKCNWVGMIQEFEQHSVECQFLTIECGDCKTFKCQRKSLPKHANECPEVTIDCPLSCGSAILRKNKKYHLANDCLEQLLDCTNDDCKEQIKRKDFENHAKNECDTRIVECEFSKYGCTVKQIKANELKQHMNENKFEHLSNKFDHISNGLSQENESLKKELKTLVGTVKDQQQQIDQLKGSVNTLSNTAKDQQQAINQLTQRSEAVITEFENETKRKENDVTFDRFDSRHIVLEQNGKGFHTKGIGCTWNSVYSSNGFNSGTIQWKIKIVKQQTHNCYLHVGIATEIHEGNNCQNKHMGTNGGVASDTGLKTGDIILIALNFTTGKVTMLKNGQKYKEQDIDRNKTYYPAVTLCGCQGQVVELV